jgi:hypothetical protein
VVTPDCLLVCHAKVIIFLEIFVEINLLFEKQKYFTAKIIEIIFFGCVLQQLSTSKVA